MPVRAALLLALLPLAAAVTIGACDTPPPATPTPSAHPSAAPAASSAAAEPAKPREIRIIAMNDLHGHIQAPSGSNGNVYARHGDGHAADAGAASGGDGKLVTIQAGGLAYVATHLKKLRDENPANIFVHAGDLTGATPLESALFHDEPPILAMNQLGLRFNAVGNHEFDRGLGELKRFQAGGCFANKCEGEPFPGAKFEYLAANVAMASGGTLFPAYQIAEVGGEKIAFVGMTLKGTPTIVQARNVEGLSFKPEAETVNALVPELRSKGASSIVVLIHQGGSPPNDTPYDGCGLEDKKEPIVDIVKELDPAIDVVVSAHSHRAYICELSGKLLTSAASYGRIITTIDLTFDPSTHHVTKKVAHNIAVTHDVAKDASIDTLVQSFVTKADARSSRVVGHIGLDLLARAGANGESNLGDFIADAMLAATSAKKDGGAQAAFMNPGGIRGDLRVAPIANEGTGTVTYGKIYTVQPFSNVLYTVSLTGAQLTQALEEQFHEGSGGSASRVLQPSKGVSYTYDRSAPAGHHVVHGTLKINGAKVDPKKSYRITISDFVYNGGEGFKTFKEGKDLVTGLTDVDALEKYFLSFGSSPAPVPTPNAERLTAK
jgi:5'-nucleotidase